MQKQSCSEKRHTILWLLLIYIVSVAGRYILALATKNFPTVYIDEYLYYSLGRSIASEGSLLYFGQPATYNYIIYPMFISPVYKLFGHGVDYFRLIELWNVLLMSLSVFPIYGLCNTLIQKRKTAMWLTALYMLLPSYILSEFVFSEAVIYPLFYTVMYCICRYLKENRIKYTLWTGVLGAVLYHTKPGAIVPAAAALLLFAGIAAAKRSGKTGIHALAGAGCLAAVFFAIKLFAEQVLGYQGELLSIYDYQSSFSESISSDYFFRTVGKYPYYFILASGILPFVFTLWRFPGYSREDKQFYALSFVCVLLTMTGTAWVANRPEQKDILFLRYVEMYIPVLFTFCMLPEREHQEGTGKLRKIFEILCVLILAYVTVGTVVWGSTTGIGESKETHFLISLAALFIPNEMGTANIIIVFLAGLTLYLLVRKTRSRSVGKICCVVLALLAVLNNAVSYSATGSNTNKALAEETAEIHRAIGDKEYIHVYAEDQCDYGLDINSRHNICRITEVDFLNMILQNRGVYTPFVPSTVRGMNAVNKTPDTDTLIIDEKIYPRIHFNEKLESFISSEKSFKVISFSQGERIVDSVMNKSSNAFGDAKATYILLVFNDECLTNPVKIRLEIESPMDQDIVISANGDHNAALREGSYWYEIMTTDPAAEYFLSTKSADIQILDYEIMAITE